MRREMHFGCESIDLDRWENEGGRCRNDDCSSTEVSSSLFNQENESLNRALVGMSRGLLQYASQCQLWAPPNDRHRSTLLSHLVSQQQESIQQLCELLDERHYPIRWGVFPTEYPRFNYVALDYLWPRIADFQVRLVRFLETVRSDLKHDGQATRVFDGILQTEQKILSEMQPASLSRGSQRHVTRTRTGSRNASNTSFAETITSPGVAFSDNQDTNRLHPAVTEDSRSRQPQPHFRIQDVQATTAV